jgi:hypothetical protein
MPDITVLGFASGMALHLFPASGLLLSFFALALGKPKLIFALATPQVWHCSSLPLPQD